MRYDNVLPFDPVGRGGMARRGAPDKNTSPSLVRDLPPAPDPSLAAAPAARSSSPLGDSPPRELNDDLDSQVSSG